MKRSDVFEQLEPQPHGWTRLRARLQTERPRGRWLAVATVSALAVLLVLIALPRRVPAVDLSPFVLTGEGPALVVKNGAALQLPTSDPSVLLYRVETL
jgi:hypothetical protein